MTLGAVENFWARFDVLVKSRGYSSIKECVEDIDFGISYSTLLTKRSRRLLPEVHTIVKIAENLDVSVDYLLFGYVNEDRQISAEEIELIRRYQTASVVEKGAIRAILHF